MDIKKIDHEKSQIMKDHEIKTGQNIIYTLIKLMQ